VKRGKPLRPVSAARRALNRRRRGAEAALYEAAPWCALCGRTDVELHGHERLSRAQGGDPAVPDMLLCNGCNTYLEDHPRDAALAGLKISKKWAPADVPVSTGDVT
jgi:hypothetical protein